MALELELSVVIPVYRSAPILPELHARLSAALAKLTSNYEIIFVDDNSEDGSWQELLRLREQDPRVRLVQLMKNFGQQRAVLCGLAHSKGKLVVTMDDDLQQRPEEIGVLIDHLKTQDLDVVIGRYAAKQHGFLRGLGTKLVKATAQSTVGIPKTLDLTSFRAMRRQVVEQVVPLRSTNPVVGFLLFSVTRRIGNVTVSHDPRRHGDSSYSLRSLINYFLCMVIDYSDLPLRFVGWVGFLASLTSLGLGAYYLALYVTGRIGVSGFITQVLLLVFFSGLILMSLGIIGSYLIRILQAANTREMYIVRQTR